MLAARTGIAAVVMAAAVLAGAAATTAHGPAALVAFTTATPSPSPTGSAPVTPAPVPAGTVKYYIVGPPVDGQQEYLYAIAVRTLGDGNRYPEIFNLNRGRPQADGDALADPAVLHEGWVLLLPSDATGPGVLSGPFPSAPPEAPSTVAPSPALASSATSEGSGNALHLLGLGLIAMIMVVAVILLRRGTRLTLFGRRRETVPAVAFEAPTAPLATAPLLEPVRVGAPAPDDRHLAPSTVDPSGLVLNAEVVDVAGDAVATVELVGGRMAQTSPAWLWLDPDAASPGPTYVALGVNSQGALCIDLNQAPDVLTVTGDAAAGQRLATRLAEQLVRNRVPVTVVGATLGRRLPGAHTVRSLAEAEQATEEPASPQVIFAAPEPEDQATVRRLTARSSPRTVLILVNDARRGRWWIQVAPAARF